MLGLQYFSFEAIWSPLFLLLFIGVAIVYLLLVGPWSIRFKESEAVAWWRKAVFLIGLTLLYLTQAGPLSLLAHLMFSAHMFNMAVSYILVPPLLLIGIPAWMLRPLLRIRVLQYLKFLMHPLLTMVFFNAAFSFYHIPTIHDYVMTNYEVHAAYYVLLLVTSLMMWWPIINPLSDEEQLSGLKKMGYIFANGVLITPACALIVFANEPMYNTFTDPTIWAEAMGYCVPAGQDWVLTQFSGPQFFTSMSALDDQQLGGVIMKLLQETLYGILLLYVFKEWYRNENPEKEDDLPPSMDPA
ncbi:cytochrome c oxidase assembly factor CtaG [Marinicrinis sediminis]|uniref:Cytochrome c oxidase assembly factor CtaG n=1 Tax=Marinicrinis sediminis TaxID=1652465 RepID=A0ABW5RGJ8_9BACL